MFLMAFGVQEMAVGWIQVAKQCQDKISRVLIFVVWGSLANIAKISRYTIHCVATFLVFSVMLAFIKGTHTHTHTQPQVGSGSVIQRAPPRQPPTPPTSTPSPSTQQTIIIPQGYPVYSIGPGGNILGMTTSSPTQPTVVTAAAMQQQRPPGLPQFMPQLMVCW